MKKIISLSVVYFLLLSIGCHAQIVNVSSSTQLQNAINAAVSGQTIVIADGVYIRSGGFYVNAGINGTSTEPIILRGSANAIISSNNLNTGYGFALKGNSYWILEGFTIYNSKKGIVADNSHHNEIKNINVNKIGDEGIHLRTYSSYNTISNCFIDSTGIVSTGTGEGIYVGSATSNWATYTDGNPDTCNYNVITGNTFGAHIVSENIDIKEGTKGGTISLNHFNGAGLNSLNYADSWLDLKGSGYAVTCNTGENTILDGFQTHINYTGYGDYNIFSNNTLTVGASGYGINITTTSSNGTASHNVVCTNNTVDKEAAGLANIPAQSCSDAPCAVVTAIQSDLSTAFTLSPNPATEQIEINLARATGMTSYTISDLLGSVVKTGLVEASHFIINITDLTNGVYLFVSTETGQRIKFVKK